MKKTCETEGKILRCKYSRNGKSRNLHHTTSTMSSYEQELDWFGKAKEGMSSEISSQLAQVKVLGI